MSQVGFPGFMDLNRRTTRAPVNPLDKSTVFSIFPKAIKEEKATITPGIFEIPPGTVEKPARLIVEPSSWWKEIDEHQPLLEIPISSIIVADSVVKDYCNGLFCCNMGDKMPGIFYLPGDVTIAQLQKEFKHILDKAIARQRNWYSALVAQGDSLWARSHGNPLAISLDMKLAANELGLQKDWLRDFQAVELVKCIACGSLRDPDYPICANCKAIVDPEAAKKFNIQFAK